MQWIAVKPVKYQWGVCTFVYSKVTPAQPELKCYSCSSYHCSHVSSLARAIDDVQEDDNSTLALFKFSLEISPEMRDYFEMATRSEEKVQLFLTGIHVVKFSNKNFIGNIFDLPNTVRVRVKSCLTRQSYKRLPGRYFEPWKQP
jgi:hypothetical protein